MIKLKELEQVRDDARELLLPTENEVREKNSINASSHGSDEADSMDSIVAPIA